MCHVKQNPPAQAIRKLDIDASWSPSPKVCHQNVKQGPQQKEQDQLFVIVVTKRDKNYHNCLDFAQPENSKVKNSSMQSRNVPTVSTKSINSNIFSRNLHRTTTTTAIISLNQTSHDNPAAVFSLKTFPVCLKMNNCFFLNLKM